MILSMVDGKIANKRDILIRNGGIVMPYKKGSCLNEEYTEIVKQIHILLKEAKERYDSLPTCIKDIETEHQRNGGKSLGWYLTNATSEAYFFAKEFGIELKR